MVRRLEVLLFTREKALAVRWADIGGRVEKGHQDCLHLLLWYLLSHNPSISSAVKTPEYTEEDPDDPEPADGGI